MMEIGVRHSMYREGFNAAMANHDLTESEINEMSAEEHKAWIEGWNACINNMEIAKKVEF